MCLNKLAADARRVPRVTIGVIELSITANFKGICLRVYLESMCLRVYLESMCLRVPKVALMRRDVAFGRQERQARSDAAQKCRR
jgi:hypothetical protein